MDFLQLAVDGLVHGATLSLAALGITLVFRILHFANVAHAELVTIGAYAAIATKTSIMGGQSSQTAGLESIVADGLALGGAIVVAVLVAVAVNRIFYRPLSGRSPAAMLISSIGVSLFLQGAVLLLWGSGIKRYPTPIAQEISVGGLTVVPTDVPIVLGALVLMLLTHVLLQWTRYGREFRALADSVDLARLAGVRERRVITMVWITAATLAACAGFAIAIRGVVNPYVGASVLIESFAAAILGGIGNPYGAMAGGVLIGITESISTAWLPPPYKVGVAFVVLSLVLLVRPAGLFGARETK